ncbi:MAG: hypothetical protein ACTSVI_13440 [Promethearchaeota archaeon]
MRIRYRNRKKLTFQRGLTIFGMLVPLVILGSIIGYAANIYNELPRFGMDPKVNPDLIPDPSTFLKANYTRLSEMAKFYEYRFENYHIPLNFTVGTLFTDNVNYDTVSNYYFSDNGALWTGSSLVAFVGKYLAGIKENNQTLVNESLRVIKKLVYGMSMMLAVPNGGLGPEYGATVARSFASPEDRVNVPGVQYLFNVNHPKYFNGSGPYKDWRWSDYTSNDEYGGYYMGIALAYKFINGTSEDEIWIRDRLSIMIDQVCAGMIRANFLGLSGDGVPTGVDQKMRAFQGATWVLLVLKMGALAHPEKYERLYYHFALNEMYGFFTREGGPQEILANYYAYNFGMDVVFALLMLEDDPALLNLYRNHILETIWSDIKYHRSPYFNAMYLAFMRYQPGEDSLTERDIEDQLMEFDINHFPDVYQGVEPVDESYKIINFSKWVTFFENHSVGNFIAPLFMEFNLNDNFYNKPLTVKMSDTSIFMWDRNPFRPASGHINTRLEEPGISFLAPYWIARGFCGFIKPEGVRET